MAAVLALAAAAFSSGTDPRDTGSTAPSSVPTPSFSVVPSVSVVPSEIPTVDSTTGVATSPPTSGATTSGPAGQTVIPLSGTEAYGLTATSDSVWAILYLDEVLSRVDPETNREVDAIDAGAGAATLLTVGGDVWLARYGGPGPSDPDVTIYRDGE